MDILHNPEFLIKQNHEMHEYVEYLEDDGGNAANLDKPNYRITVPASDDMVLMADGFLQIRGEIVTDQPNPVNYTNGKLALVNTGWNLFEEAKYKINSSIIESVDNPGEVRNIKNLIEYSQDYSLGQGNQEMFYPDSGDGTLNGPIVAPQGALIAITAAAEVSGLNTDGAGVLRLTENTTDNSAITLRLFGQNGPVVIPYNVTQTLIPNLFVHGGGANSPIDNNVGGQLANGNVIKFYVEDFSRPLYLIDNNGNYVTEIRVNAATDLTLQDVPENRNIAEVEVRQYLGELTPFSSSFNVGYEQRRLKTALNGGFNTSQCFELYMPIRRVFKFMQTHGVLMKGASHIIELKRNNFGDMLYTQPIAELTPQVAPKVRLTYMSLWVPKIKLSLQYEKLYLESINDQAIAFSWDTYEYERSTDYVSTSGSWDVATVSGIPKRMYVVLQNSSRFSDHTQNNMVYDNLDLQEIYVRLNSTRFPEYEYEINYGLGQENLNKIYMRAYNAYLNACMVTHSDDCVPAVSYEQFKTLYPIYCFDLRSKPEGVFKNASNIQIKVHWRLRSTPAVPYRLVGVFEQNVETLIQFLSGSVSKLR